MEFRQECGVLASHAARPLSTRNSRSGIPLRNGERGSATAQSALLALVDEARDSSAQTLARLWPGQHRVSASGEPQDSGFSPAVSIRAIAGGRKSFALSTTGSVGPLPLQRLCACRTVWPNRVPVHRRKTLPAYIKPSCDFLVLAATAPGATI